MKCRMSRRVAALMLIPALALLTATAHGQTPSAPPPAVSTPTEPPAATPATPATPPPIVATPPAETPSAPPATSPPAAAQTPAPSTPPVAAQPPATAPPVAAPKAAQPADPFGEEQTLTSKKVVAVKGTANWDSAFETLVASLKTLTTILDRQGIKATGPVLIVYTSTDDTGFTYQAQIPVDQDPKNLGKDMSIGRSPEGKTLKFVHRGSYDNMDNTYEAITNHLDDKRLEAKDTFIEEYVTDPLKTSEDKLIINVFVPLK